MLGVSDGSPGRILRHLSPPHSDDNGALMKITLNYKHVESRQPVEKEVARRNGKLGRLLKAYSPDLVRLHGSFEKHPRKEQFDFSLHLSLPTGALQATGVGTNIPLSVKHAFAELEDQIKRHQARLRKDYEWKRKRPRARATA